MEVFVIVKGFITGVVGALALAAPAYADYSTKIINPAGAPIVVQRCTVPQYYWSANVNVVNRSSHGMISATIE
jgi:hypothetical protein